MEKGAPAVLSGFLFVCQFQLLCPTFAPALASIFMQKALSTFLKAALALSLFLLVVSLVYVTKSPDELDPDSMLLAMLLLSFSGLGSLVIGIILFRMKGK